MAFLLCVYSVTQLLRNTELFYGVQSCKVKEGVAYLKLVHEVWEHLVRSENFTILMPFFQYLVNNVFRFKIYKLGTYFSYEYFYQQENFTYWIDITIE